MSELHQLYERIRSILLTARQQVASAANTALVEANWHIGQIIVEVEQQGQQRAAYGQEAIKHLAKRLSVEFGASCSERNLLYMRQFYLAFPILNALRSELTWTHYRSLLRVENPAARTFYLQEAIANHWNTRALDRQINSLYYERLLTSRNKTPVVQEMTMHTHTLQPEDVLKDPYILEFLQLRDKAHMGEAELEAALIAKLQSFLLELGRGFAFVARQKRIATETKHFYIDLVFYNYPSMAPPPAKLSKSHSPTAASASNACSDTACSGDMPACSPDDEQRSTKKPPERRFFWSSGKIT